MTVYSKGRTKLLIFSIFSGCFFLFTQCKKTAETIGADFLAPRFGLDVRTDDTSTLIVYSSVHDSIPTRGLNYFMLGALNDPDLGVTKANIYSQVSLPVPSFTFEGKSIDSVVLQLKFATESSVYPSNRSIQTFNVYKLTEDLSSDSSYFSNRNYQVDPTIIGTYIGPFRSSETVSFTLKGDTTIYKVEPHVRIPLNLKTFLENGEAQNYFKDDATFRTYLKGLAIVAMANPSADDGALAYMNLTSTVSSIVVYYGASVNEQEMAVFPLGLTNVKTNQFIHSTPASIQLQPYKNGVHANRTYVQPAAGIKTRILIPNLLNYVKNNNIALVEAELVFTLDPSSKASGYNAPGRLLLVGADSLGRNYFLKDIDELDSNYYGGGLRPVNGEEQYRFRVTRQFQDILNTYKKTGLDVNYGLNLFVSSDFPVQANRAILNTDRLDKKVKLNLTYTVIK